jgi:hypothetical protein
MAKQSNSFSNFDLKSLFANAKLPGLDFEMLIAAQKKISKLSLAPIRSSPKAIKQSPSVRLQLPKARSKMLSLR